jgi:hypothetical protein
MSARTLFLPTIRGTGVEEMGAAPARRDEGKSSDGPPDESDEERQTTQHDTRRRSATVDGAPLAQLPSQRRDRRRFTLLDSADPPRR